MRRRDDLITNMIFKGGAGMVVRGVLLLLLLISSTAHQTRFNRMSIPLIGIPD
jgi:hypothetical protein